MIERLEQYDKELFLFLNGLHAEWLDSFMWFLSQKLVWIPLYALLLSLFVYRFGWKQSLIWILPAAVILIILSDQISVQLFKKVFERYRPCHNLDFKAIVHLIDGHCGGQYGFVSSHAANTFALAGFVTQIHKLKKLSILIFIWAALVSYSRIYLGVHYPMDIVGGAVLGILISYPLARIVNTKIELVKT